MTVPIPAGGAAELDLRAPTGRRALIEATEAGIDVLLEVGTPERPPALRADTPSRRVGTLHVIYQPGGSGSIHVRLSSKEHAHAQGSVLLSVVDLDSAGTPARCTHIAEMLAAADADYSSGADITYARRTKAVGSSRHFYLRSAEEYQESYEAANASSDASIRASAALALASTCYLGLKDWLRMREWAERARDYAQSSGDAYGAARGAALLAASWIEAPGDGDAHASFNRARRALRAVEAFHLRRQEGYDAGIQEQNIAFSFFREGDYAACLREYGLGARRFRALHEDLREGGNTVGMAVCEWGLDRLELAEKHYRAGVALERSDAYWYLSGLSNLAALNEVNGHLDEALRVASEALARAEELQARIPIQNNLFALGRTYFALGDVDQAIYYLEKAVASRSPDEHGRGITLRALAVAYRQAGRLKEALETEQLALPLTVSTTAKARIEIAMALDESSLGNASAVIERVSTVLSSAARSVPSIRVEALIARARISTTLARPGSAIADLETALGLLKTLQDPALEFQAYLELGRGHRALREWQSALVAADRAIEVGQLLRRQTASPDLRAQRQEPLRPAHDLKIAILMDLRRDDIRNGRIDAAREFERLALVAAEHSRAQTLLDFSLLNVRGAGASADVDVFRRRARLYQELGKQLSLLDSRVEAADGESATVLKSREEVARLRREIDLLNLRVAGPVAGSGFKTNPNPDEWRNWLSAHAPDSVLVEYWLGSESAYAWTISAAAIHFYELGSAETVDRVARELHDSIRSAATTAVANRLAKASELYRLILQPIAADVAGRRGVIVVADRALAYVPFAGLVTQTAPQPTYFVEAHDVAMAPAIWWLFRRDVPRRHNADGEILIVADPVYGLDDPRIAPLKLIESVAGATAQVPRPALGRLPSSAREADAVARLFGANVVRRLEGVSATREAVLAQPLDRFQFIHIASHGSVDSRMPQLASLVLSEFDAAGRVADPEIRASDVMGLNLDADLVTLSACDTALGRNIVGEGASGVGYAALARGARAVLASLWAVPDEITADVMTDTYGSMRQKHMGPASALGDAMRAALKARPALDPAYWAAYQLTIGVPPS